MKRKNQLVPAKEYQIESLKKLPPNKSGWWWGQVKNELFPSEYAKRNLEIWDEMYINYFAERLKEDSQHPLWQLISPMPFDNYPGIIEFSSGLLALRDQIEEIMDKLFSKDTRQHKISLIKEIIVAGILHDLDMSVRKVDLTQKGGPDFLVSKEMYQDIFIEVKSLSPVRDFINDNLRDTYRFAPRSDIFYNITLSIQTIVLIERSKKGRGSSVDHKNSIVSWIEKKISAAVEAAEKRLKLEGCNSISVEADGLAEITLANKEAVGSSLSLTGSPDIRGFWKIQRQGIDESIDKFANHSPGIIIIPQPGISMFYQGNKNDVIELVKSVFDTNQDIYKNIIGVLFIARSTFGNEKNWQYEYDIIKNDACSQRWENCSLGEALNNVPVYIKKYKGLSDIATPLGEYRVIKTE